MVRAAGAVLWREAAHGVEFALVHRPVYDDWSFPKGKRKNGEHVLRALRREVIEETGCRPLVGRRLSSTFYLKDDRPKQVDYWLATPQDADWVFEPNAEVDRIEWLPYEAAARRLSYPHDAELLREAVAGPLRTTPFFVLRHGSAGDKHLWADDDAMRPLDPRGRGDAAALAPLLEGFGPLRVVSSATARCMETVLPYALRAGVNIVTDRAFTVGAQPGPEAAAERLVELVSDGVPALVCTHGEVIHDLIGGFSKRMDATPPEDPALRKGSFWILHVADGRLVSTERHAPR